MNERQILIWLVASTRGGPTRKKILLALRERPMNAHQLSMHLNIDYRAVRHHLRILRENRLLEVSSAGYGGVYFLHPSLEANPLVDEVLKGPSPAPQPSAGSPGGPKEDPIEPGKDVTQRKRDALTELEGPQ